LIAGEIAIKILDCGAGECAEWPKSILESKFKPLLILICLVQVALQGCLHLAVWVPGEMLVTWGSLV
jgi:hypothetical protein